MPSFNKVILIGHVTRDPQFKQLPNGTALAEFGMAMNRKFNTAGGEAREEVCFVDCTAWGKQAEVIHQYIVKGKPLMVEGRLTYDSWEDKTSGAKRSKLTVNVENFQFVGGKDDGDRDERPAPAQRQPQRPAPTSIGQGVRQKIADRPKPTDPFGEESDQHFDSESIPF